MVDAADAPESAPVHRLPTKGGPDAGAILLTLTGLALIPLGVTMDNMPMVGAGAVLALVGGWLALGK